MKNAPAEILSSLSHDELTAIAELKQSLKMTEPAGLVFFCSSSYDLNCLAEAMEQAFLCPVIGCTTAGEITRHYQSNSITALALCSSQFAFHSALLDQVDRLTMQQTQDKIRQIKQGLKFSKSFFAEKMFGFLLSDGLSMKEESIISMVYESLGGVNVFGGSAGDDLNFNETFVYYQGNFYSNAAVIALVELRDDFSLFNLQHFTPSDKELITTEVDNISRTVYEINGEPAADVYAHINDLQTGELNSQHFALYPLMLNLHNHWYIRSIVSANEDKSLSFYCAIDTGVPLTIGQGVCMIENLEHKVAQIECEFEEIYFTLGCDCILRQLEIKEKNQFKEIEALLSRLNFVGFSTYGEQLNGVHFNQTLVAIVVGKKHV